MTEQDTPAVVEQGASIPEQGASIPEQGASIPEQGASIPEQGASIPEQGASIPEQAVEAVEPEVAELDLPQGSDPEVSGDGESEPSSPESVATSASAPASPTSAHAKPDMASTTSALEREGEVAADFLEQLLDIADLDGDIDVDVDGDRAAVAIVDSEEGRVSRRLVGPDGKVLDALQELTRLAVQAATGERSRLMLDVAGFRAERRAAVVTTTKAVIATVKSTNERVAMDPMSAFERKVVHDEVLAAGLISESEGVEPQRHVVILPA